MGRGKHAITGTSTQCDALDLGPWQIIARIAERARKWGGLSERNGQKREGDNEIQQPVGWGHCRGRDSSGSQGVTWERTSLTPGGRQRLWERHLFVFSGAKGITKCDQEANRLQMENFWLSAQSSQRLWTGISPLIFSSACGPWKRKSGIRRDSPEIIMSYSPRVKQQRLHRAGEIMALPMEGLTLDAKESGQRESN